MTFLQSLALWFVTVLFSCCSVLIQLLLIGDTLRIYPQSATGRLDVYYYQNPVTDSLSYSSWIADSYPDELAMWAAAIVFARTGFTEMANDFQKTHVVPFKEMLISSQLLGTVN